jgi:hypothetical protein
MKIKPKLCDGCGNTGLIWKNSNGKRYCKRCSLKLSKKPLKISSISHKQKLLLKEYSQRRVAFLSLPENTTCRAKLSGCFGSNPETMTIHHSRGRGEYLLDESSWIPLCVKCHKWVEENPKESKETGLSFSRLEKIKTTT